MDNFFSSPRLFDDLDGHKIISCGTVWSKRKDMPCGFEPQKLKLKRGDIRVRTRGGLTALVWKDRREVYMLTNMDPPPAERNFCDKSNCLVKPHVMEWYNWHMGFVTIQILWPTAIRWVNVTSSGPRNCFSTVLNSWILLSSCWAKYTHRDFWLLLVRNLIEEAVENQDHPTPSLVGRMKCRVYLDWLKTSLLLKKDPAPWSK